MPGDDFSAAGKPVYAASRVVSHSLRVAHSFIRLQRPATHRDLISTENVSQAFASFVPYSSIPSTSPSHVLPPSRLDQIRSRDAPASLPKTHYRRLRHLQEPVRAQCSEGKTEDSKRPHQIDSRALLLSLHSAQAIGDKQCQRDAMEWLRSTGVLILAHVRIQVQVSTKNHENATAMSTNNNSPGVSIVQLPPAADLKMSLKGLELRAPHAPAAPPSSGPGPNPRQSMLPVCSGEMKPESSLDLVNERYAGSMSNGTM
ncbi:hypothetical protein C8F04DRAFT_1296339 [Mycena alexandri]|uniref:Uncharacterized protein n=1 Tax=Mycena alexandri TaxID=1745969 RepID=A0AAD6SF12_9AGAR|nr:hypothetical protein C8F04DRAFT_1296339 [Mycena alexandri]